MSSMLPKDGETFELLRLSLATPFCLNASRREVGLSCMLPEDGESCKLLWLSLAKPSHLNPFGPTDKA